MVRNTYSPLIEGDTIRCKLCGQNHIVEHAKPLIGGDTIEAQHKKTAPLYFLCKGKVIMADKNIVMNGLFK